VGARQGREEVDDIKIGRRRLQKWAAEDTVLLVLRRPKLFKGSSKLQRKAQG